MNKGILHVGRYCSYSPHLRKYGRGVHFIYRGGGGNARGGALSEHLMTIRCNKCFCDKHLKCQNSTRYRYICRGGNGKGKQNHTNRHNGIFHSGLLYSNRPNLFFYRGGHIRNNNIIANKRQRFGGENIF